MHLPTTTLLLLSSTVLASALDPNCAPGGNFDLSKWKLQLPTGQKDHPTEIQSSSLKGCAGYTDKNFFTGSDGSIVMKVPGDKTTSDCVSTKNSDHCRCEFRENSPISWSPYDPVNRLYGDLKVTKNAGEICVGQIHIDGNISKKPVAELYLNSSGELNLGVQLCRDCSQNRTYVDRVSPNARFNYEIRYENNALSVAINGKAFKKFSTYDLDGPKSYFKAGNYNQKSGPTEVHFYGLRVTHS